MYRLIKVTTVIAVVCTMACGLVGCMGRDFFTSSQSNEIVAQGLPVLESFVKSLPDNSLEIKKCYMMNGAEEGSLIYGGKYLTRAVQADFENSTDKYRAILNLDDGQIWTDYYMFDLNTHIERQLKPYFDKYGFEGEYDITGAENYYVLHYKNVSVDGSQTKTVDSYVDFNDMLPSIFSQSDENERADAYLKNAPICGFSIRYNSLDGELPNPRIISDYLMESGNYCAERTRNYIPRDYEITVSKSYETIPEEGLESMLITISYTNNLNELTYELRRNDFKKVNDFCFKYTGGAKYGNLSEFDEKDFEAYSFPIIFEDNKLIYNGYEDNYHVELFFEEKPSFDLIKRTVFHDHKTEPSENLVCIKDEKSGYWFFTLEDEPKTYSASYKFDANQEIEVTCSPT